jgi:dolichol-phosphate mannosyltransferase
MLPELALIIPTLNEAGNIEPLTRKLLGALEGVAFEIIFVDDNSRDATRDIIKNLAAADPRIRLIHRVQRRGLASACVEGMLASFSPLCAVMDADLQHDENLLPQMLASLRDTDHDMVVGSRFLGKEGVQEASLSKSRQTISDLGNRLAALVTKVKLTDPLSGFFMIRRSALEPALPQLSAKGFKILVDILASSPRPLRVVELPFEFRQRHAGASKLDPMVMGEYLFLLADKSLGRFVPVRFAMFVLVGLIGVFIHFAMLAFCHHGLGFSFEASQIAALLTAMTTNYIGNNWLTYRDRRLKGRQFWLGLFSFYLACSLGAIINYQIAEHLHQSQMAWQFAGLVGAVIGAVWNYGVTATFTWRPKKTP